MKKKIYINDIVLNFTILIVCIAVPVGTFFSTKNEERNVVISFDGENVAEMPLDEDAEFSINGVIVTVLDGRAFVKNSDCPDGLCLNMKHAKNVGDSIICIPNKVSVRISGGENKGADVIAG